jgi:hypothetical protein
MKGDCQTDSGLNQLQGAVVQPVVALRRDGGQGLRAVLTAALLILLFVPSSQGAEDSSLEYKVKAGFLINFTKFVDWPGNVLPATNSPIVIGLLAEDPVAPIIRDQLNGKVANGRPIVVRLLPDFRNVVDCHMLFLSRAQKGRVDQLLAQALGKPILTVGELDHFALDGGVINFVRYDESFRFEVNLEAAEKARLKISAKLASMAIPVKPRR